MHPRRKLLTAAACLVLQTSPAIADECTDAACFLAAARAVEGTQPGEAARLYLAAYRLEPKIDPLAGYGMSLAADKQYVAAAEALEKATEEYEKLDAKFKASDTDAQTMFAVVHRLELVREELRKLGAHIGRVKITALPDGVTVMRKGGSDVRGSDSTRLIIQPGGDVLVFTYPSGRTAELNVNVVAGLITTVDVPPEPAPQVEQNDRPLAPDAAPGAKDQRLAYIIGGAGAALFVFGFGYTIAADAPRFEVTGALIGTGLVGLGVGGYFWYRASQARKAASATAVVPMFGDSMLGIGFAGSL